MTINYTITTLKRDIIRAFAVFDSWFDKDDDFLDFRPPEGKSVRGIFASALSAGEALMDVIDSGSSQARTLAYHNNESIYELNAGLEEEHIKTLLTAFVINPASVKVCRSLPEIRSELRDQLDRCLCHLELLRNGEGTLFNTDLAVDHSIDLYQCMQLLAIIVRQHTDLLMRAEHRFAGV